MQLLPDESARAFANFQRDPDPANALKARTGLVDSLVTGAAAEYLGSEIDLALVAVGGYGRRELFPHSDIDLLLLVENEAAVEALKHPLSQFLRVLWDARLRISHSVRTVADCCRLHDQNLELHISLLDLRFLSGEEKLFQNVSRKLPEVFQRNTLIITQRFTELVRHRHLKFNHTVYHLEPNIKEAPGGIRDIHALRWLSQIFPQHEEIRQSLGETERGMQFLYALRCFLHYRSDRDNNLLTFELQDEVARLLPPEPVAAEEWMRTYFRHARQVYQSALRALEYAEGQQSSLLRNFRDRLSRISTAEFTVSRERVFLRNPAEILRSSESILRLFTFVARHGIQLSWDTQRRIRGELASLACCFRTPLPHWSAWRELLSQPHAALALREMQETGLLAAAIPGWQSIDSLVVRDFYHRYTVDEHTLVAVQTIDHAVTNAPGTPARLHQLAKEDDDLAILRLGLILHDFGKGTHPGDHVRGSLVAADAVLEHMQVPPAGRQAVRFLIEHHLDLSLIMNGRDLDDPATARFLTSRVGTQEDLRRLTLLTYADISAVNPTSMTPWRLEQLWRVYSLGVEQLTRELATDRIHEPSASASPELARFLEGFPKRYLRTHTPEQIEHHLALERKRKREGVAVEIEREAGAYLLTVLAHDEPGLFASLCGALASFAMNIVKAEAAANAEGCILDLIRFTDPLRTLELNPSEVNRLQWTIECVVRRSIAVSDLLKRRRRIPRPSGDSTIVPAVRFNDEASDVATLVDFVGEDRPGLLYDLASAISARGCNIEVVMIDTEAHKAIDVFYLTRHGAKLNAATQEQLRSDLTRAAVRSW